MDPRLTIRPDNGSRFGFEHAPISKLLLLASGAATVNFLFLPDYHGAVDLYWPVVLSRKEVWRLLTSQIVYDSTVELLYGSALLYHFRVLERQWGSRKFASFVLAAWTLTIGTHFICCHSKFIHPYLPVMETMAGGLYGPIFALMFFYNKDIYSGSLVPQNGVTVSGKWLAYLIAFRMLFTNDKSYVAGILGLLSGILYNCNFLYINQWLRVPDFMSSFACSVYNWFRVDDGTKPRHKKTFAGATEDIHDDMMYDYMLKMQTSRTGTGRNRQVGQGYSDTMQPFIDPVEGFFDSFTEQNHPDESQWQHIPHPDQSNT